MKRFFFRNIIHTSIDSVVILTFETFFAQSFSPNDISIDHTVPFICHIFTGMSGTQNPAMEIFIG